MNIRTGNETNLESITISYDDDKYILNEKDCNILLIEEKNKNNPLCQESDKEIIISNIKNNENILNLDGRDNTEIEYPLYGDVFKTRSYFQVIKKRTLLGETKHIRLGLK